MWTTLQVSSTYRDLKMNDIEHLTLFINQYAHILDSYDFLGIIDECVLKINEVFKECVSVTFSC